MDILLNRAETRALLFKALNLPVDDTTRFIFTETTALVVKQPANMEGVVFRPASPYGPKNPFNAPDGYRLYTNFQNALYLVYKESARLFNVRNGQEAFVLGEQAFDGAGNLITNYRAIYLHKSIQNAIEFGTIFDDVAKRYGAR